MKRYVSLLRGINVGSSNRIKKEALEELYRELGFTDIVVVIQSGNVIFSARTGTSATHARRIAEAFEKKLDLDVPAVVLDEKSLAAIVKSQPFAKEAKKDASKTFIGFHAARPGAKVLRELNAMNAMNAGPNRFESIAAVTYLHCPDGIGRAKLPAFERILGVKVTFRNVRVATALLERMREQRG